MFGWMTGGVWESKRGDRYVDIGENVRAVACFVRGFSLGPNSGPRCDLGTGWSSWFVEIRRRVGLDVGAQDGRASTDRSREWVLLFAKS